jgi:ribosomal protein L37E
MLGELFPCQHCGKPTVLKNPRQKYCVDCGYEVQRLRKAKRAKRAEVAVGEEFACEDCGKIIVRKAGNHYRCEECSDKKRIERQNQYKLRNGLFNVYTEPVKPKYTIAEMNQAARKNGMTYGRYAAALKEGRVAPPEHIEKKKRGRKKVRE